MILNDFESGKLATLCYGINVATGLICKYSVDDKIHIVFEDTQFCKDFETFQETDAYLLGIIVGATMWQEKINADNREQQVIRAKKYARRSRTKDFNPWDFVDKKLYKPVYTGVYLHDKKCAATDTYVLVIIYDYDYPSELEGKIVDVDLNPIGDYRYPDVERILPDVHEDNIANIDLDSTWLTAWAKQAKQDKADSRNRYLNICGTMQEYTSVIKIAKFVNAFKCDEMVVYTWGDKFKNLYIVTPKAKLLSMGYMVDQANIDDANVVITNYPSK